MVICMLIVIYAALIVIYKFDSLMLAILVLTGP